MGIQQKTLALMIGVLVFFCAKTTSALDWKNFEWRTGQIVGFSLSETAPISLLFELGTRSRLGHLGMIVRKGPETWVVESTSPRVRKTKLEDFLKQAPWREGEPQVIVGEPEGLNFVTRELLAVELERMVTEGVPYNYSMYRNPDSKNCSELVYDVLETIGLTPLDSISQSSRLSFPTPLMARLMKMAKVDAEFSDGIEFVSPASLFRSASIEILASDIEMQIQTDDDIIAAWKHTRGAKLLKKYFGLNIEDYENTPETCASKIKLFDLLPARVY